FEFHQGFAIQDCGAAPVFNDRLLPRAWIRVGGSNNLFEQRNTANLELVDESPIHRRYYYKSRGPHGFWQHYYVLVWTNQDMGSLGQRGAMAEIQSYVPSHERGNFSSTFDVDQIRMRVGHEVDMHYAAPLNVVASYSSTAHRTNV